MIQFQCPKCKKYVRLIAGLIPLDEELWLFCENCHEETAYLLLRREPHLAEGAFLVETKQYNEKGEMVGASVLTIPPGMS